MAITKRRLKTLSDLRKFMSQIMNDFSNDNISPEKASKLGYLCNIMKGIIHDNNERDIIERLEKIEKAIL